MFVEYLHGIVGGILGNAGDCFACQRGNTHSNEAFGGPQIRIQNALTNLCNVMGVADVGEVWSKIAALVVELVSMAATAFTVEQQSAIFHVAGNLGFRRGKV